jgi:hypothetical protein
MKNNCIVALWLFSAGVFAAEPDGGPLTPAQEGASFRLADDQLAVELVAAEPDVVSPVGIAWDAAGRMFVAEMSDYPNVPDKGRVKLLTDRDGDGRHERVRVFADGLPFPNGVLPWKGGVLVTAAPDIWFLKDNDGDGVADERRKMLTGFGEGNQQLQPGNDSRRSGLRADRRRDVHGHHHPTPGPARRNSASQRTQGSARGRRISHAGRTGSRTHPSRLRGSVGIPAPAGCRAAQEVMLSCLALSRISRSRAASSLILLQPACR